MKQIYLLFGIMLALMLCITPVAAVTGDDFEVLINYPKLDTYTYFNMNDPDEEYTEINTEGTRWSKSFVTFKPANIPGAPVMIVNTESERDIRLPQSVDDWEIKFYSSSERMFHLDDKYLKNAGVVNLKKFFGKGIWNGLELELSSWDQKIVCPYPGYRSLIYYIPEVK